MDAGTISVYREVIKRYEGVFTGEQVNVIDPDGRTPAKREIKKRLFMMKLAVNESPNQPAH